VSPVDEFRALDLRCHTFLHDVPLHDVWVIDLAGGGPGRTMRDVDALGGPRGGSLPVLTRALFSLRFAVGRACGWDRPRPDALAHSYLHRLTDDDRARSLLAPGTMRGLFRMLYVFADETVGEVRNATVHAFLVMALRPRGDGYRLYWAIYVKPVGRLTSVYMAAIDPFRRFIVYPAMIRQVQAAWARAYV
jgi:hypothetical protein